MNELKAEKVRLGKSAVSEGDFRLVILNENNTPRLFLTEIDNDRVTINTELDLTPIFEQIGDFAVKSVKAFRNGNYKIVSCLD